MQSSSPQDTRSSTAVQRHCAVSHSHNDMMLQRTASALAFLRSSAFFFRASASACLAACSARTACRASATVCMTWSQFHDGQWQQSTAGAIQALLLACPYAEVRAMAKAVQQACEKVERHARQCLQGLQLQ